MEKPLQKLGRDWVLIAVMVLVIVTGVALAVYFDLGKPKTTAQKKQEIIRPFPH